MTLLTPTTPATLSSEKVQERHRDRLAVVYVRQSTPQQIEQHPVMIAVRIVRSHFLIPLLGRGMLGLNRSRSQIRGIRSTAGAFR